MSAPPQPPTQQKTHPQPLSTEQIQKMLEENYVLFKAIVDQQNLGRPEEMKKYQNKLQENLIKLAELADAVPAPAAGGAGGAGGLGA